jgi:serine/threonine protein kinase
MTAGDWIGGHFEILEKLGAGGMGEVWKARDTRLNRTVAIKILTGHTDRFEREARAIAALNHPHICAIYDVGPDYLVMEYVEGAPPKAPMPLNEALRLGAQVAGAMAAAHAAGITHRDLKPDNILITKDGRAKVLDFGLAKLADAAPSHDEATRTLALTDEGTIVGTTAYMSPEQAEGKKTDSRSDIFSLGAVLYELLTGRKAFQGDSRWRLWPRCCAKIPSQSRN